jgi:hypothetical protein
MTQTAQPRIITAQKFWQALVDAGVFREDERIRRIVIDADPSRQAAVVMYVERWGDERLLDVALTLEGVEIRGVPAPSVG